MEIGMKQQKKQPTSKKQARAEEVPSPTANVFVPLDKNSFTPLYFQIQTQLMKMIESGQLRVGDPLPSEEELSRIHGVSRMTSRQALQALKNQGFASRHKGKGSFVLQPKVEKDITHLSGFTAEMSALGLKASSKVLDSRIVPAPAEIASRLQIEVGAAAFQLNRLRFADSLPVAIEELWLPAAQFAGIEKLDFAKSSLYQTLRERYGIRVGSADEILEARSASKQEAALLDVAPRSSLLVISRTLVSVEGRPIETARSIYRGDRYRAVLRIPATAVE
jgi:GntR family transcriptional regulator